MSRFHYQASEWVAAEDHPIEVLIMAAMRQADAVNAVKLRGAFPEIWQGLAARYNSVGGILPSDPEPGADHPFVPPGPGCP